MTEMIQLFTETMIADNKLWRPLLLFFVIFIALAIGRIIQFFLKKSRETFHAQGKDITVVVCRSVSKSILFFSFTIGLKQGVKFLILGEKLTAAMDSATSVLIAISLGWIAYCLVDIIDAWLGRFASRTKSKIDDMLVPMVRKSLRVTIVVLSLVQIAQTLSDRPLTSIIAGLGVVSLAIALASQDTLKNFFGSLVIFADKPFELGDRIVVDGHDGPVEEVGFRSTRIRTLTGHLVTIPNAELANKTVLNISKRPYIRRLANITITYDTPPEKVERGIEIIKEILHGHEGMHPDFPPRVIFNDFTDTALNILVLYWYHPPLYWDFCDFNERVNIQILRRFNDEGIDFAFPSQTVYLAGDPRRPLKVDTRTLPGGVIER